MMVFYRCLYFGQSFSAPDDNVENIGSYAGRLPSPGLVTYEARLWGYT